MSDTPELEARPPLRIAAVPSLDGVCFWLATASALSVIIGAVGPWTTAWGLVPVSGTGMHGWREVTVGALALALLAVHHRRRGMLELLAAALTGLVGATGALVALSQIDDHDSFTVLGLHYTFLRPAWGVYAVLIGALTLAACASLLAWRTTYSSRSTRETVLETDDERASFGDH
jgi:hypothetical protein